MTLSTAGERLRNFCSELNTYAWNGFDRPSKRIPTVYGPLPFGFQFASWLLYSWNGQPL